MNSLDYIIFSFSLYYLAFKGIDIFFIFKAVTAINNKVSSIYDYTEDKLETSSPSITIIIPFHNETYRVFQSIYTAINQDYLNFSIILVDDGSTNTTTEEIIKKFNFKKSFTTKTNEHIFLTKSGGKNITLIIKKHTGKADSLNLAAAYSPDEYILFVDADTVLKNNALKRYSYYILSDHNKSTIFGSIMGVNNSNIYTRGEFKRKKDKSSILTMLQEIEYYSSIFFQRIAFSKVKSNFIVSGANLLIKRSSFLDVNGYSCDSITEDMDLCMKVIMQSYRRNKTYPLSYIPEELSTTEVPFKINHFVAQRSRWFQGLLQTLWKFKLPLIRGELGINCLTNYFYYLIFVIPNAFIYLVVNIYTIKNYNIEYLISINVIIALIGLIQNLFSILIYERENEFNSSMAQLLRKILASTLYSVFLVPLDKTSQYLGVIKTFRKSKKWGLTRRQS